MNGLLAIFIGMGIIGLMIWFTVRQWEHQRQHG